MHIQAVEPRERALSVRWSDATTSDFPYLFLRDNCPSGFHAQTQERTFDLLTVPETLKPSKIAVEDEVLVIDWEVQPPHRTVLAASWLADHRPGQRAPDAAEIETVSWGAEFLDHLPRLRASDLLSDRRAMKDWLIKLRRDGLTVVSRISDSA